MGESGKPAQGVSHFDRGRCARKLDITLAVAIALVQLI